MNKGKLPELLAPAGSFDAFIAAVSAGADAVYLGASKHNARVNAKNFSDDDLKRAFEIADLYGKKIYITLNTLVGDRELLELLDEVEKLRSFGAEAFIVQDLGLMSALKRAFPDVSIHASTQCVTHSLDGVKALAELGASRAVVARELDKDNLYHICRESPIEIEAFVHGALCVCHSGACLFSSLVGGRSGNRGECAQPCRLPYSFQGSRLEYPLSLSDLTLSSYVSELIDMGVSSLKIEGRMKSPEYVAGVVGAFRSLLDERRNAEKEEKDSLARLFSRNGFTDGYYSSKLGAKMYGVRREEDKKETRKVEAVKRELNKIKIDASLLITNQGGTLTLEKDGISASATLPPPTFAETRPIDREFALSQVSKLGDSPFELESLHFSSDGDYIYPRSLINSARREAVSSLITALRKKTVPLPRLPLEKPIEAKPLPLSSYVIFYPHRRVTKKEAEEILTISKRVYLPIFSFPSLSSYEGVGVVFPVIIKDSERKAVEDEAKRLFSLGVRYAYAETIGAVALARSFGFEVLGGLRLNLYNSYTAEVLKDMGLEGALLSAELTSPQKRDIKKVLPVGETAWGRAPLMITENCIMNLRDACRERCDFKECRKEALLTDRKGVKFPVFPEYFHRCQIFNSVPTYTADKPVSDGVSFRVIFITDEKDSVRTVEGVASGNIKLKEFTRKG